MAHLKCGSLVHYVNFSIPECFAFVCCLYFKTGSGWVLGSRVKRGIGIRLRLARCLLCWLEGSKQALQRPLWWHIDFNGAAQLARNQKPFMQSWHFPSCLGHESGSWECISQSERAKRWHVWCLYTFLEQVRVQDFSLYGLRLLLYLNTAVVNAGQQRRCCAWLRLGELKSSRASMRRLCFLHFSSRAVWITAKSSWKPRQIPESRAPVLGQTSPMTDYQNSSLYLICRLVTIEWETFFQMKRYFLFRFVCERVAVIRLWSSPPPGPTTWASSFSHLSSGITAKGSC